MSFPYYPQYSQSDDATGYHYDEQKSEHLTIGNLRQGCAVHFETGQWGGRTIRAEIEEIQSADRARKYAEVDRRALDPPPVVELRLFEIFQNRTHYKEIEVRYEDVHTIHLLCSAELIAATSNAPLSSDILSPTASEYGSEYACMDLVCYNPTLHEGHPSPGSEFSSPRQDGSTRRDFEIACQLVGSKVVSPQLFKNGQRTSLVFVFSDLAVRKLGFFSLRYKFFSLIPDSSDSVIQAECVGDVFRVYSTKDFPGLPRSTELTRMLSAQGASLSVRKAEPKRNKRKGLDQYDPKASAFSNTPLTHGKYSSAPSKLCTLQIEYSKKSFSLAARLQFMC